MAGTALGISEGGTSQKTAPGARIALGLGPDSDVTFNDGHFQGDVIIDGNLTVGGAISVGGDLGAIEALTGTGFAARTAADTWALRTFQAPTSGFTITNPAGVAGDPVFILANDLAALEGLTGTHNIYYRSAADTWSSVIIGSGLDFTVDTLSSTFTLGADLTAIEALTGTGFAVRTAADTWALRTLTATAPIAISNPAGTAGNPVISINTIAQIPIGAVWDYAGLTEPSGWLFCFGQAISRTTYSVLFGILSTTYGAGDGSTTFNLPDLRGRVVAGQDDMGGVSANRLTTPINGDTLGASGGVESVALTTANLAAHNHTLSAHTHAVSGTTSINSVGHTHTFSDTSGNASTTHTHDVLRGIGAGAVTSLSSAATFASTSALANHAVADGNLHTHAISGTTSSVSANHTHTFSDTSGTPSVADTGSTGSGTAVTLVQPTFILNKIIYTGV